jgi:GNAT superfamily N-acetyltransferase
MEHPPRLAVPADRQAIEALVEAAYGHYVERIGRKPGPMVDDYARLIADGHVRVAERDGSIVGLVVLIPEEGCMLLDNIAVDPALKGKGLGKALMMFAEEQARSAGYGAIRLYTHEKMVENIALYGRSGYVETRRGEEKGLRRVYMTKAL